MTRILGDLFSCFYILSELKKEKIVVLYIKNALQFQGINYEDLAPDMVEAMKSIVINTAAATLTIFLLFHFVVYFLYFKEKAYAKKYVVFISWCGLFLTSWVIFEGLKDFAWVQLLNIFSLPLFLFVILGHKHFFPKTSERQNEDFPQVPTQE
ncbi:MAG: hypothetical protein ACOYL6_10490 [Bacteriovoracaceae bacterium]